MKKSLLVLWVTASLFGSLFLSCKNSTEKIDDAQEDVTTANENVDEAEEELAVVEQDYQDDLQEFRLKSAELYDANNRNMEAFNLLLAKENKIIKERYNLKIAELKARNENLKKTLDEYQDSGTGQWETFKTNLSMDMEKLGNEVADLKIEN
jgi:outer membrane murein-binding lipoprotein Lpp